MDLYSQIMNIQICDKEVEELFTQEAYAGYKLGKREMRSDAAELALKADARIEELECSLHWILTGFKNVLESKPIRDADEIICHIEKLLEGRQ